MEETEKAAMKIIKILEAENASLNKIRLNQISMINKLLDVNGRHVETILSKQKHIVALEKDLKSEAPKKMWAAIHKRITGIGRKYESKV